MQLRQWDGEQKADRPYDARGLGATVIVGDHEQEVDVMIDPVQARQFLDHQRLAVVGASDDPKNIGGAIYRELAGRDRDPVAVNPNAATVAGRPCFPDLSSIPGSIGGAIVVVPGDLAIRVVRDCIEHQVERVWLFKGFGAGAVSDEAVALCQDNGVDVVAGACPLMFLEPVAGIHKLHRSLRRLNGSLAKAS